MKKLWVIVNKVSLDKSTISKHLDDCSFEIIDIKKLESSTDIFSQAIILNDKKLVLNPTFEAKLMQSADEKIPSRLLIPDSFDNLEDWKKQYTMLHELGHYLSNQNEIILKYIGILEKKELYNEIYMLPLEIEAEKFVMKTNYDLYLQNFSEVYSNYFLQIKEAIDNGELTKENIGENFYAIFEIRLFRFAGILCSTLKDDKHYAEFSKMLLKIIAILNSLGEYSKTLTQEVELVANKSDITINDTQEYLKIAESILKHS